MTFASNDLPNTLAARFSSRAFWTAPADLAEGLPLFRFSDCDTSQLRHIVIENTVFIQTGTDRHMLPDFFRREDQDGCNQTDNRCQHVINGSLCCTSEDTVFCFTVKTILDDIQIEGGHVDSAEIEHRMECDMEIKRFIAALGLADNLIQTAVCPFIQFSQLLRCDCVGIRVEVADVAENITGSVADLAVGFCSCLKISLELRISL